MEIFSGKKSEDSKFFLRLNFDGLRMDKLIFYGKNFMLPSQNINYGTKENPINKKRGTHFCAPVFGKPPEGSPLRGAIPQHGFIRDMRFFLKRIGRNKATAKTSFNIPQTNEYPWEINGKSFFRCNNNSLIIEVILSRPWSCEVEGPAPVNFGFHPYWANKNGVSVFTKNYNGPINRIILPSYHMSYLGPVEINLHGIGTIIMEMEGDVKDPEIVMWSDHKSFSCVELVAANSNKFDTEEGIMLEKGDGINIVLSLKFIEA